jgi:hypothetical protein
MPIYFDQNVEDNWIFLPSEIQLKNRFVCQDMTYERPLKKNLGTNLHKLEIFRRSILPIGSTKKNLKKFLWHAPKSQVSPKLGLITQVPEFLGLEARSQLLALKGGEGGVLKAPR